MNFRVVLLLLFALTTRAAVAQPLPDRQPIVGRALNGKGQPLAGVVISIRRQSKSGSYAFWGATTATNERGEFRFSHAETGRYFLDAAREGFAPIQSQSLNWNGNSEPLQLKLERLVTLQLQISRPDGAPAAKTPVWMRLRARGKVVQTTLRALPDANGRVRWERLPPADYSLFVVGADGFFRRDDLALRVDASLDVGLQKGGSLRVSVRDNGTPTRWLGGAELSLLPQASGIRGEREIISILAAQGERLALISRDGDGTIALSNIPPGRYLALVSLVGYRTEPQRVEIAAGQSLDLSWVLPAKPAASLALQLRSLDPSQIVKGEMALRFLPIKADGTLASEEASEEEIGWTPNASRERRALSDDDGKVTIFPLRAGRYRVFVAPRVSGLAPENDPAEAASVDVTVPPDGATATLTLKSPTP
ncbi:MAG: carboxypeptidase regulatory-like domain-containing protein [Armatimonadetes bacterium]|nr:carboxypeptidase regulatory-like domain-containing protein [Armatimonadota bacterium]